MLWRVSVAHGSVLAFVLLLLAVTPIEISAPIAVDQLFILIVGFAVILVVDLLLVRRVLLPLRRLTDLMRSIAPDKPGQRVIDVAPRDAEVAALTHAFNEMLDRLETERRSSARAALAAQERERARVARELHDEIGQSLTAVLIHAERVAEHGSSHPSDDLRQVADEVRVSLDDVRRIARKLRPEALDDLGLVNALIALCSRLGEQSGVRIERDLAAGLPPLGPDVELVIYRVAQEGLFNVVRHAGASDTSLSLQVEEESLVLEVRDNGEGLPKVLPTSSAGISGMRERALLVGGQLDIRPRAGGGTQLQLRIPKGSTGA